MDNQVEIPGKDHPRWREIVTGQHQVQVENLGLKLLLTTLQLRLSRSNTEETLSRSIDELHGFFTRHGPAVGSDLSKLFSQGR